MLSARMEDTKVVATDVVKSAKKIPGAVNNAVAKGLAIGSTSAPVPAKEHKVFGDRNAAAYIETQQQKSRKLRAIKMLGVRALAVRDRAASAAKHAFENELSALANRVRKKNDDIYNKKVQVVEVEEEEMSPALAAAVAKIRNEKINKEKAALEKQRENQVLHGDRNAAVFMERRAAEKEAAMAKKKMSMKEQAEIDRQNEEKRIAFENEMKARSANLKKGETKTSKFSLKDMFAGSDMSGVTKHSNDDDKDAQDDKDDGKSDFLKEIERKKNLKKAETVVEIEDEIYVGVNETDGDKAGSQELVIVKATGKSITCRWVPWAGDKATYVVMKDGEMMTATEPGDPPAATVLPLESKMTYRIKVIALDDKGLLDESEFAERNCSTAGAGQTYKNMSALSEKVVNQEEVLTAEQVKINAAAKGPKTLVALSVLRRGKTSVTLAWQPFGGASLAESKRKCFCVMCDDELKIVTEQGDKTVASVTEIKPGVHSFRVMALNFDGSVAEESATHEFGTEGFADPKQKTNEIIEEEDDEEEEQEKKTEEQQQETSPQKEAKDLEDEKAAEKEEEQDEVAENMMALPSLPPARRRTQPYKWQEEFMKMRKIGLPDELITMKIKTRGVSETEIQTFLAEQEAELDKLEQSKDEEAVILTKLGERRQTIARTQQMMVFQAKQLKRKERAKQRRSVRMSVMGGSVKTKASKNMETTKNDLRRIGNSFSQILNEELEGLAIEYDSVPAKDRPMFENAYVGQALEKIGAMVDIQVTNFDEEGYVEDLNELVSVSDTLQLDENQFEMIAEELDMLDEEDIDALADEFDSVPQEERTLLFGN
eukprot:m.228907 g.228907  ORF g.228907 m.228907 type:complete len:827 (-) comp33548_c8_seq18:364-2844(-)